MRSLARYVRVIRWHTRSALARRTNAVVGFVLAVSFLAVTAALVHQIDVEQEEISADLIDTIGRTITIRSDVGSMPLSVVEMLTDFSETEWVLGFGAAIDLESEQTGRATIGSAVHRSNPSQTRTDRCELGPVARASPRVLQSFGHVAAVGSLRARDGAEFTILPVSIGLPEELGRRNFVELECRVGGDERIIVVVVLLRRVAALPAYLDVLRRIGAESPDLNIDSIESSEDVLLFYSNGSALIRSSYASLLIASTAVLSIVSMIWSATQAASRRKDFGRRRSLGASRAMLFTSSLLETLTIVAIAVSVASIAVFVLQTVVAPWKSLRFWPPSVVLLTLASIVGTSLPLARAVAGDPIEVLRSS